MNSICVTIAFFALHSFCSLVSSQIFCSDLLAPKKLKFYPVRHCQRSNKTRIAAKTVGNLEKCAQFAEHNQGLAFNFGHGQKPRKMSDQENLINLFETIREKNATYTFKIKKELELANDPYFNCEVLDCPETGNMSTIVNDTRYDYYSLYGYAPANATCLPTIGLYVFYYEERKNYTFAVDTCESQGGRLANVMSSTQTNYLSSLVYKYSSDLNKNSVIFQSNRNETIPSSPIKLAIHHAFVGLREIHRKGEFIDSNEIPIQCYRYRAWQPKHPTEEKRLGCVAVTESRAWKIFDCRKRMPFICELSTSKPRRMRRFNRRCSLRRPNN